MKSTPLPTCTPEDLVDFEDGLQKTIKTLIYLLLEETLVQIKAFARDSISLDFIEELTGWCPPSPSGCSLSF